MGASAWRWGIVGIGGHGLMMMRAQHGELLRSVLAPEYEFLQLLRADSDEQADRGPHETQVPRSS